MNSGSQPTAQNCSEKLTVAGLRGILDAIPRELDNCPIMVKGESDSFIQYTQESWEIQTDQDEQPSIGLPIK